MAGKIEDNRMTIKDLLVMVEQRFSEFSDPVDDARLQRILDGATLSERDWSARPDLEQLSDILIKYNTRGPFNMQQLDKELRAGFHVYWSVIHFDDIVITYFQEKLSAFKYYRTLTPEILTCERAIIDSSKGIIVAERLTGDKIKMAQNELFKEWKRKKCAADVSADGVAGVDAPGHRMSGRCR